MARSWTTDQKAAIDARSADILVAAAAGSGKTAVLVERIIERITDETNPVDIDRLLVVTFTNAAAAEMRERIGDALMKKLEDEPASKLLARQLALLPTASITTIHSYCLQVLRANFNALGLDPTFRIADTTENELLRMAALEDVIEEMYEDEVFAEDFLSLTEAFMNIRNPEEFYKLINRIYDFSMSLPEPEAWLTTAAENLNLTDFEDSIYAKTLVDYGKQILANILEKYEVMLRLSRDDDGCEALYQLLLEEKKLYAELSRETSYKALHNLLSVLKLAPIPRVPKNAMPMHRETVKDMRDDIKKHELSLLSDKLFATSSAEQVAILQKSYPQMRCLSEVVRRLMVCFDAKKAAKNILNFNDLEHGCYRLFVDETGKETDIAQAEKERFDEILIDEYQDTSALQEAIFSAIKKDGSLFLVGDIKQSIYRFRNTNPKLFADKKDSYGLEQEAPKRKIVLSKNFRSRAEVLDAINFIFERMMSQGVGEVTYNEEEKLYPGAIYDAMENPIPTETEIYLVEMPAESDEDTPEKIEAEAMVAAKRITDLIEKGYQVQGKNGPRKITYRDICILMRSGNAHGPAYCKVLADWGIPCYCDAGDTFLQSREIVVMLSLLKIIDNPHQDIPLLAVLRSLLWNLSTDELAEIRLADRKSDLYDALKKRAQRDDELGGKLNDFLTKLALYREKSREYDTAELIWYLLMQTGFYEAQAALRGGELRRMNLRLLYTRAADFEKTGLKGLYNFVRFIDEYESIQGDYGAARNVGEEQDVVRVMSIHKSKGLEFPVVIISGMDKQFNEMDLRQNVLIHSDLGYGPKYIDSDLSLSYDNGARQAVEKILKQENLSEEMRILYVAMTRAREKLILTAAGKDMGRTIRKKLVNPNEEKVSPYFATSAKSYMDWVLMALYPHSDAKELRELNDDKDFNNILDHPSRFNIFLEEADVLCGELPEEADVAAEETETTALPSMLDYRYPFADEAVLPAKITVSEVKRKMQGLEPDGVYLYPQPNFLRSHKASLSAAEMGTAMHGFMEHLDYARVGSIEEIGAQLSQLVEKNLLTEEEAATVSAEKVFTFTQTELGKRMQNAEKLCREVSFSLYVDAEPFFDVQGKVMLQGMIDCVLFEPDGISVIDYKTDRDERPEITADKYRVQLDCYAKAAETMYGQKVLHKYLYLFHHDTFIEL